MTHCNIHLLIMLIANLINNKNIVSMFLISHNLIKAICETKLNKKYHKQIFNYVHFKKIY